MSRLAELLKQKVPSANSANVANPEVPISKISSRVSAELHFPPDLEMRMHAMFVRWKYNHSEATEFLELARANPTDWVVHVGNDEIFHARLLAINSPLLPC